MVVGVEGEEGQEEEVVVEEEEVEVEEVVKTMRIIPMPKGSLPAGTRNPL